MPRWLPYRGDSFPTNFKPRKRFVNLRTLRWSLAKIISMIIAITATITFFVLRTNSNSDSDDKTYIAVLVTIWIFVLILITGILKLNKFRKGYDVDLSYKQEKKTENQSDEL